MSCKVKKIFSIILLLALCLCVMFAFTACGFATEKLPEMPDFKAEKMAEELSAFVTANPDRTSLTQAQLANMKGEQDGEYKTARWLDERLSPLTGANVSLETPSFTRQTAQGDKFEFENVILSIDADDSKNEKNELIVIGTYYDNAYQTVSVLNDKNYNYLDGTNADGALTNGTGVVTLLALADYFADEKVRSTLTFDIDIVFYGMGCISNFGPETYLSTLNTSQSNNLLLAITVEKMGGDNIIMYTGESKTQCSSFFRSTLNNSGVGAYVKNRAVTTADLAFAMTDKLQYTPYEVVGSTGAYIGKYNVLTLTSGENNPFYLYERESSSRDNVSFTKNDTLERISVNSKNYAEQMAVTAQSIVNIVTADGFVTACRESMSSVDNNLWLNNPVAPYIVVASISFVALVLIVVFSAKLEKKYRDSNPKKNIKVAVFGMDYESPDKDDIFVDIRSKDDKDKIDPFDLGEDDYDPFDDNNNDKKS